MQKEQSIKIHSVGDQWNSYIYVLRKAFGFSNEQVASEIRKSFQNMKDTLRGKDIDYAKLKGALTPPDAKKKFDFAFVFDSTLINEFWYGRPIFEKIFGILLDKQFKESKNSIFSGDLLYFEPGFEKAVKTIEKQLGIFLNPNKTYHLVFISNLSLPQKDKLEEWFKSEDYYVGATDMTLRNDYMKRSLMLPPLALKYKDKLIVPSVEDGYRSSLEEVVTEGFEIVYMPDELYDLLLSYNYHSVIYSTNTDNSLNIINAIYAEPIENYELVVEPKKFEYIKSEKAHILKQLFGASSDLGDDSLSLELFTQVVRKTISNYIFNLEINEHVTKFNTILDTADSRIILSFEYNIEERKIRLITAY